MTTAVQTQPSTSVSTPAAGGTLTDQLRVTAALVIAGLIFWTVGWVVMQPIDPAGPVTILAVPRPITTLATCAGLAVVAGGLATLIAGRNHPDMGAIAVGVGLAALNLHGAESDKIGGYLPHSGTPGWPTVSLVCELWLWLAIVGLGYVTGRWCHVWMFPPDSPEPLRASTGKTRANVDAASDAVIVSVLPATLLAALGAYFALPYLCGSAANGVLKFQMYFAPGAAMFLGAALAQLFFRPAIAWWPLLAVGLVGSAAYVVAAPTILEAANPYLSLRYMPGVIARPLPIEFAALGAIGGLIGITAPSWFSAFEHSAEK